MPVTAVVGTDEQVFFGIQVLEDVAAFQRLDNTQTADGFGIQFIDAFAVPRDAAVGNFAFLSF